MERDDEFDPFAYFDGATREGSDPSSRCRAPKCRRAATDACCLCAGAFCARHMGLAETVCLRCRPAWELELAAQWAEAPETEEERAARIAASRRAGAQKRREIMRAFAERVRAADPDYYRRRGRLAIEAMRARYDRPELTLEGGETFLTLARRKGGETTKARHGAEHYRRITAGSGGWVGKPGNKGGGRGIEKRRREEREASEREEGGGVDEGAN